MYIKKILVSFFNLLSELLLIVGVIFQFTLSRPTCNEYAESGTVVNVLKNWLKTHEEAQVGIY